MRELKRIMVANRGEIATRVFRAVAELGKKSVSVFSKEDKYALFRAKSDESYMLDVNKGPIDAYLDIDNIIRIALAKNVDAIHPGYGFLSENTDFVAACEKNGIVFIGPKKESMMRMGDKLSSKKMAIECGVPIIKGTSEPVMTAADAKAIAADIGYPVILKASNGGGGRGMRIVNSEPEIEREFHEAREESRKAFGSDKVFIEKYIKSPKHVEIQVLGDQHGNLVHLFDRDCSVQRRHQKVVEFAPSFAVSEATRQKMYGDAVRLAKHVGYSNAGTLEFLLDADENYYFIEMNPRIQVEHTVTEMITGIDIVQSQILIAEGYRLDSPEINIPSQEAVKLNGYSIQARVTTEDPANNFFPDTGKITVYRSGSGFGIRLDAASAFAGSEITPYYDSLLVKVVSHDRSFDGAIRKLSRSLKEMRIRGVKTNIPFLVNVLHHPQFSAGKCTTSFIEDAKELFVLPEGQNRATRMIEFIGNKIVNERVEGLALDEGIHYPRFDESAKITGLKDEFKRLGAKGLCDKILAEQKLYLCDTTMRDAHQSLFATRMRTADIVAAAPAVNHALRNGFSVEAWGGATFDVAYRFLKESPWRRLERLSEEMPNTLIQMLLRSSNTVGYKNYPDNVVREFIRVSAEEGVDVFRIFDSLNWIENMRLPIETALKTGKIVEGAICYTGDLLNPRETKYTLDYYLNKALELERAGAHIFAIKDMAGLLKPYAAKKLFAALKNELRIPVRLHTHDSTGNGVSAVLMAAEAGADIADAAIEAFSGLTSQPSLNSIVEALAGTPRDTGLNIDELNEISKYYASIRPIYAKFESGMNTSNTEIYKYEIPGGQYSNLLAQVKELDSAEGFENIKRLYKEANDLLGNIVKVTPTSKVVGDLAIFMYKNGLNKDNILTEGKSLSYPDSVVDYFKGMIGQPDGGFPEELQKIVLKGETPITVRPGAMLPDEDFGRIDSYLWDSYKMKPSRKRTLSYALYPKVYDDYCKHLEYYKDVSKLSSRIYFYGLERGEETTVKIEEGKYLIIKFVAMGEARQDGKRILAFEVNGSMREVEIVDKKQELKSDRKIKADKNNPLHLGSPIPGTIGKIIVKEGEAVAENAPILTIESMKMETTLVAKKAGIVDKILVKAGASVTQDELLAEFKEE